MPKPNPARSGGPRTTSGLKVASKNAVQHGLTTPVAASAAEAATVDDLRGALVAQYSPQTPLEALQIDRIARTAAKLQRLHAIEEAAFRLAQENALPPVAEIVASMGPADAAVQADAVRILLGQGPAPSFGLDDAVLAQMCDEIRAHGFRISAYADVRAWLPSVHAFVEQNGRQVGTSNPGLQLQALAAGLQPLSAAAQPVLTRRAQEASDAELLALMKANEREQGVVSVPIRPQDDSAAQAQGLKEDLDALLRLQLHRRQVDDLVRRYPGRKALLKQAALPPAADADRLMRYQVALDRQLSKCMGELLQMLAMRPPQTPHAGA